MRRWFFLASGVTLALMPIIGWWHPGIWWLMLLVGPLIVLGGYDMVQRRNTILRNFPVLGHLRYFFEFISPEIQQYFIERHTDGTPLSKNHRDLVDMRANDVEATYPFGTELVRGLVVAEKRQKVANYHRRTLKALGDLMAACGAKSLDDLSPQLFLDATQWQLDHGPRAGRLPIAGQS